MSVILVLKKEHKKDKKSFLDELRAEGYEPEELSLSRHIILKNVNFEDFDKKAKFKDHKFVEYRSDGDQQCGHPAGSQTVTLATDGLAPWHLPRIIRRTNPWFPIRGDTRVSTFNPVRTGAGVNVFLMDSGADFTHEEFGGRAYKNYYYTYQWQDETDGTGHGTNCLSVAIGDVCGVAKEAAGVIIMFTDSGSAVEQYVTYGLDRVLTLHNLTANPRPSVLSWSWLGFTSGINAAVEDLIDAGIVVCVPAGNTLQDLASINQYPAESDADTICVGGLNISDHAYYNDLTRTGTCFGDTEVDILAPAQSVYLAIRTADGGGYAKGNGTSYATPQVAGVIACMLQGYEKPTTRTQVQAIKAKLLANASTGYKQTFTMTGTEIVLPDKILYMDPKIPFEVITGLIPKTN